MGDAVASADRDSGSILLRKWRKVDSRIDGCSLVRADLSATYDDRGGTTLVNAGYLDHRGVEIDAQCGSSFQEPKDRRRPERNHCMCSIYWLPREHDFVTLSQRHPGFHPPRAHLCSLRIEANRRGSVLTNERYDRLHFLGRRVRQIDPQEIHASAVKSLDDIAVQRCRAEGAKNLDLHEPEILDGRVRKNDRRIFSGTKKPLQAAEIKDITALSVRTSSFQGIRPQGGRTAVDVADRTAGSDQRDDREQTRERSDHG
jgi:hypothetical protein